MNHEQVNDLIPKAHARAQQNGDWDASCFFHTPASCQSGESVEMEVKGVLEEKLDDLIVTIAKTMVAFKAGNTPDHRWEYEYFRMGKKRLNMGAYEIYERVHEATLQFWLAEVLFEALDLMAYYEAEWTPALAWSDEMEGSDTLGALRMMNYSVARCLYMVENNPVSTLRGVVTVILHIVELEKIDLMAHIAARLEGVG